MSSGGPVQAYPAQREKLPVIATCMAGYRAVYDEWGSFVRLAAWPFIWIVAAQIAGQTLSIVLNSPGIAQLIELSYLVLIPFAVAWLSMLILREKPDSFQGIHFGRTELKFLAYLFLIPLVCYLPALVFGVAAFVIKEPITDHLLLLIGTLITLSAGAYVSLRLWLVFPEIAIGAFKGLRGSWHKAEGAVSRICAIAILVELPLIIVGAPFAIVHPKTDTGLFAIDIVQIVLAVFSSAVYRAAQAIVYNHLTKGQTGIRTA